MDACPGGRQLALAAPDPFDRLPAGQAIVEQYDLLSVDAAFDGLGVSRFWK
jgi:PIN domain nuclease of toxin-antitoxin system